VTVDLYRDDLGALSDMQLFSAIEEFCRIGDPLEDRPQEDYRLDFKEEWQERALRVIASFANTFGGLLFIGISEEGGKPKEIVGVQSRREIKTKIASSIASNISPTPAYDLGECTLSSDPTKRLCVVRVRKGVQIHLLTTKGENNPVYIRNADESRPARAAELRALIEQRLASQGAGSDLPNRLAEWHQFGVSQRQTTQPDTTRVASPVYFKVVVLPSGQAPLILDQALEGEFQRIVCARYPGVSGLVPLRAAIEHDDDRGRDWYQMRWLHTNLDYERRWRINSRGEFGFATQAKYPLARYGDFWSLCDIALALISTLAATRSWWGAWNYWGDARLVAWLDVGGLKLYQLEEYPRGFAPLFYKRGNWPEKGEWPMKPINVPEYPFSERDMTLPTDVLSLSNGQSDGNAVAEVDLNYASLNEELPEIVALVMNQLIRQLKHAANLKRLREEMGYLSRKLNL
jgi:hypothetical protein